MRKSIFLAMAGASLLVTPVAGLQAKKEPKISGLELQQLQSHDFEASKEMVFGAVMSVLQDAGYRIQAGDRDTGLITGVGTSESKVTWLPFVGFGRSKKVPAVSAFIEEIGPSFTRVRLNFVMSKNKANQFGAGLGDEEAILDPAVYKDAFEKIDQGVFMRQSLASKPVPVSAQSE